jgi:hypothetical protein
VLVSVDLSGRRRVIRLADGESTRLLAEHLERLMVVFMKSRQSS